MNTYIVTVHNEFSLEIFEVKAQCSQYALERVVTDVLDLGMDDEWPEITSVEKCQEVNGIAQIAVIDDQIFTWAGI